MASVSGAWSMGNANLSIYSERADGQTPQRRLAAVVFIDVVGYSRLMERDEKSRYQQWVALRSEVIAPLLSLNGGHVVNGTGDGFLLRFKGPLDAVKFALDVQRVLGTRPSTAK